MGMKWYALHTKPHKETIVSDILESKDIEHYCPTLRVKPVNPRARRERPYFPGYLFVHVDLDDVGTDALRWVENTHGLVRFGDTPAVVPDNLIHQLRRRLSEVKSETDLRLEGIRPGDEVTIVEGPLAGYQAIFDTRLRGSDRVQVLLKILSQGQQRVQLSADDIRKRRRRRR